MHRCVAFMLAVAACGGDVTDLSQGQWNRGECAVDLDCATGAVGCCECAVFAVPISDPSHQACAGVLCPDRDLCPANVRAICW